MKTLRNTYDKFRKILRIFVNLVPGVWTSFSVHYPFSFNTVWYRKLDFPSIDRLIEIIELCYVQRFLTSA